MKTNLIGRLALKVLPLLKNKRVVELIVKVIVAAVTAFLTAITTTSCMGYGPL